MAGDGGCFTLYFAMQGAEYNLSWMPLAGGQGRGYDHPCGKGVVNHERQQSIQFIGGVVAVQWIIETECSA